MPANPDTDIEAHNAWLLELAMAHRTPGMTLERFAELVCRAVSERLGVGRASVWLDEPGPPHNLRCFVIHGDEDDMRDRGLCLAIESYPNYSAALRQARALNVREAASDPQTSELADYLRARRVASMLDGPLFLGGHFRGVLCLEHTGSPRTFTVSEVSLVASLAELLAAFVASVDRDRAEAELRASEQLYRGIVDDQTEYVLRTDARGSIRFANHATCSVLGRSLDQLCGHSVFEFATADARGLVGEHAALLTPDRPTTRYEQRVTPRRGGLRHVAWVLRGFFDDAGTLTTMQAIGRDVTQEREHEGRLREAQRLQSLAVLAGGIAHDFNNLLTPIQGYAELLMRSEHLGVNDQQRLQGILGAAQRASELVRQILIFSRREDGVRVAVEVAPVIRETVAFLRASIPSRIELELAIEGETGAIMAQPSDLYQILSNLSTNALQAMPAGGRLRIAASQVLRGNPESRYLQLMVSDTGHGIAPEIRDRIFEPFFTTKPEGQGTGLGLSVVHGTVLGLGGTIDLKSEVGKGTSLVVFLPSSERAGSDRAEVPVVSDGGGRRVLCVDDEPSVCAYVHDALEGAGYRVATCSSPNEALALFAREGDTFHLVITDLTMPTMGGIEVAWRVHQARRGLPVLLMSGFGELLDRADWEGAGIVGLLAKPFPRDALVSSVHAACAASISR